MLVERPGENGAFRFRIGNIVPVRRDYRIQGGRTVYEDSAARSLVTDRHGSPGPSGGASDYVEAHRIEEGHLMLDHVHMMSKRPVSTLLRRY